MCRPDKWDSILDRYDNTWGISDKSGESSAFISLSCPSAFIIT